MNLLFSNDRRGHHPASLYAETADPLPDFAPLKGETRTDVAIIGGGYTGLSAALHLAQAGRDVVLCEAHRVGFGASGRNGGQIGTGQRLDITTLERSAGKTAARALWDIASDAVTLTRDLAARAGVPVHDGVAHALRHKAELSAAEHEIDHLATHYGHDQISLLKGDAFRAMVPSPRFIGGTLDMAAGHLHPLNLAIGMARLAAEAGARIYENTHIHAVAPGTSADAPTTLRSPHGRIIADQVILAGNGYLGDLVPKLSARVMPINNFIVATAPLGDRAAEILTRNIAVHDSKFVVNYWRLSPDQRLIFGGGENVSYRFPSDIRAKVRPALAEIYPNLAEVELTHGWGGTLAITMNRMPCFARPGPNILSASGFSGHGVAMATMAGKLMASAILGDAKGFETMANPPSPTFPGGTFLRWPLLVAGMRWYALRDKLGI